jgi:hypothetical protein
VIGGAELVAQSAPGADVPQQTQQLSEKGELARVSAEQQLLWIKTADERELQFRFTDETEIVGAEERVEGLATRAGAQVTVDYRAEDGVAIATRIEVQADAEPEMPANERPAPEQ